MVAELSTPLDAGRLESLLISLWFGGNKNSKDDRNLYNGDLLCCYEDGQSRPSSNQNEDGSLKFTIQDCLLS